MTETTTAEVAEYPVTWETLPANYELPDNPVENLEHPALSSHAKIFRQRCFSLPRRTGILPVRYV